MGAGNQIPRNQRMHTMNVWKDFHTQVPLGGGVPGTGEFQV